MCIRETIIFKQLEVTKKQLTSTDRTVTDIVACLGFSSLQYFSQVFSEKVGRTPTQHRRYTSSLSSAQPEHIALSNSDPEPDGLPQQGIRKCFRQGSCIAKGHPKASNPPHLVGL